MPEYLLEVRSQEMPPALQKRGLEQLARGLFEELMGRGIGPLEVFTASTPRRVSVVLKGLPEREREREELRLGPPAAEAWGDDGAPTPALADWAAAEDAAVDDVERVKTETGERAALRRTVGGQDTRDVLGEVVPRLLDGVVWGDLKLDGELRLPRFGALHEGRSPWPRGPRWGDGSHGWVRPVRSLLSLYDGEVLPLAAFGVTAGDETAGHPLLSPQPFRVRDAADYGKRLRKLGIEPLYARRREILAAALAAAAEAAGGELRGHQPLLGRVAARCEIAGVVTGTVDPEALALPAELAAAALVDGQEVFPVWRGHELLPAFLAVVDRPDDPEGHVRRGFETAVAGHLADRRFQYDEDRKVPLAERRRRLDQLTFHEALGTYAEKVARVRALAALIADEVAGAAGADGDGDAASRGVDRAAVAEAVELMKADLTTATVREHPRLRGVVGGLYAREEGYVEAVWRAVYEQYRPRRHDDAIPTGPVARVVAVADRLDSLVGFAGLGRLPLAGATDPLRLRGRADGLLRIVIEGELALDLDLVAARAVLLYGERLEREATDILGDLQVFLGERLRFLLGRRGHGYDEVEAALAVGFRSLPDLVARVAALHAVRDEPSFAMLAHAAKRLSKIVDEVPELELRPELLVDDAERELHAVYAELRPEIERLAAAGEYGESLRAMAGLVPNLDRFFSLVLVMDADEERRDNRIALLQAVRRVFWKIGRLKELAVDGARPVAP